MSRIALSPLIKAQVDKLTAAAGGHRLIGSSAPIIISKKATCSNTSSHNSSSYTSTVDQMSSSEEVLLQSHRDSDDEHSAARDRILVKNKRRQATKEKLTTLRETEDKPMDLFSSTPSSDDEPESVQLPTETSTSSRQPLVELTDLDAARSRLRVPVRPRDHSADQILLTPYVPSVQRSVSFKRPQDMNETKFPNRSIYRNNESESKKSSEEHIYDNLDIFKRNKTTIKSDSDSSSQDAVKTRVHSITRLRPVTMHIPETSANQTTSEFENVFNQFQKRAPMKKVQMQEEEQVKVPVEETVQVPVPLITVEEKPVSEPIVPVPPLKSKVPSTSSSAPQPAPRRKTVGGVHLPSTNKVAVNDNKPTASWIDIAKQKQSKFQSIANEGDVQEDVEPITATKTKEPVPEETHSNKKALYEQTLMRRRTSASSQANERDSIRALKASNPNRINNLIQLFDK